MHRALIAIKKEQKEQAARDDRAGLSLVFATLLIAVAAMPISAMVTFLLKL